MEDEEEEPEPQEGPEDEKDKELEEKQYIITKEILDNNYSKTDFINFLIEKKENGDDLNYWDISELEEEIKEFTKSHKPEEPQKCNNTQIFTNPQTEYKSPNFINTQIRNNSRTDNKSQNRNNSISIFLNQNGEGSKILYNSNIPKKKSSCCPCWD